MFGLDVVTRHRAQSYGMLALWIVAFHVWLDYGVDFTCGNVLLTPLSQIIACGAVSVDAFLFISGICLCTSYERSQNLERFWLRRFMRVFPPALIIFGTYWFFKLGVGEGDWGRFIWQSLFINPLVTDRATGNWFITGILVLYFCYPAFYRFFCASEHRTRNLVVAIVCWYLLCVLFGLYATQWFGLTEVIFTRFPVFMFGTYLGPFVREKREAPLWLVPVFIVMAVAGYANQVLVAPMGNWYWRIGLFHMGVATVFLMGLISDAVVRFGLDEGFLSPLWRFFGWVGGFSLELYCMHQVVRRTMVIFFGFDTWGNAWLMLVVLYAVSIPLAWVVSRLIAYVRTRHEEKLAAA